LDIHAEEARVKIDAPVEVANQHHRVPNPKGNAIDGFFAAHSFPLCIDGSTLWRRNYLSW
jgi:hypothetical protein